MLQLQLQILQENLFSPVPMFFNPDVCLMKVLFGREKKDNLH
jgi:hypothetical protein